MNKKEKIVDYLENCSDSDLLHICKRYESEIDADLNVYFHEGFYDEELFTTEMYVRAAWAGGEGFNFTDEFVKINAYGNFETSNNVRVLLDVDYEEIADYILENNNTFYNDEIRDILQEED